MEADRGMRVLSLHCKQKEQLCFMNMIDMAMV